jgi:hypothetical protein
MARTRIHAHACVCVCVCVCTARSPPGDSVVADGEVVYGRHVVQRRGEALEAVVVRPQPLQRLQREEGDTHTHAHAHTHTSTWGVCEGGGTARLGVAVGRRAARAPASAAVAQLPATAVVTETPLTVSAVIQPGSTASWLCDTSSCERRGREARPGGWGGWQESGEAATSASEMPQGHTEIRASRYGHGFGYATYRTAGRRCRFQISPR